MTYYIEAMHGQARINALTADLNAVAKLSYQVCRPHSAERVLTVL